MFREVGGVNVSYVFPFMVDSSTIWKHLQYTIYTFGLLSVISYKELSLFTKL